MEGSYPIILRSPDTEFLWPGSVKAQHCVEERISLPVFVDGGSCFILRRHLYSLSSNFSFYAEKMKISALNSTEQTN